MELLGRDWCPYKRHCFFFFSVFHLREIRKEPPALAGTWSWHSQAEELEYMLLLKHIVHVVFNSTLIGFESEMWMGSAYLNLGCEWILPIWPNGFRTWQPYWKMYREGTGGSRSVGLCPVKMCLTVVTPSVSLSSLMWSEQSASVLNTPFHQGTLSSPEAQSRDWNL